jgi:microcystin-dependent protein
MSSLSASNYIVSSGQNLDDIFEKRNSEQDSAQATNYYNTDGQDLNKIFLPKSSSSTAATTTNYKVNGNDLNTIFEALNTSTIGSILIWPSSTAPTDYLLCDGTSYNRSGAYSSLFSAIGTTYGSTSSTAFNVPDFTSNSKTFMSSNYSDVEGGNNSLDLSQNKWNYHTHTIDTSLLDFSHTHTIELQSQFTGAVQSQYFGAMDNESDGDNVLVTQKLDFEKMTLDSQSIQTTATFSQESNSTPSTTTSTIEILNPYITINYIIKYQ